MIDHDRKTVFVHIPKTAGISIYKAFGRVDQMGHLRLRDHGPELDGFFSFAFVRNPFDRLVSTHAYLRSGGRRNRFDLAARDAVSEFETFDSFACNIVECQRRLAEISAGTWGIPSPPEAVTNDRRYPHLLPQVVWTHHEGDVELDFVGRFERLAADWAVVARRLGMDGSLEHHNATRHRPYREMYSWRARRAVRRAYAADLDAFGYSF